LYYWSRKRNRKESNHHHGNFSPSLLLVHTYIHGFSFFRREWREALQAIINDVSGFAMKRSYICHSYSDSLALLKNFRLFCSGWVCIVLYCIVCMKKKSRKKIYLHFAMESRVSFFFFFPSFSCFVLLFRSTETVPGDLPIDSLFNCYNSFLIEAPKRVSLIVVPKFVFITFFSFLYRSKWFSTLFGCRPRLSYNITYEEKHSSKLFNMIYRYKKEKNDCNIIFLIKV
jgi:hypothetical protein